MSVTNLARVVALALLLAVGLAACAAISPAPTARPTAVPATPPAGAPTTLPGGATAVPTTAPNGGATAVPTAAPTGAPTVAPTARPAALIGPEWTPLVSGDPFNDGVEAVIAYKHAPADDTGRVVASEMVIVRRGADGQPRVFALVTTRAVFLNGSSSPISPQGGPDDRTTALLLDVTRPAQGVVIAPLGPSGEEMGSGITLVWNPVLNAIDLRILGDGPTGGWPGPGWQLAHEGDFNGDGKVEQVFFRPSGLQVDPAMRGPGYAAYTHVADEVIIAQVTPTHSYAVAQIDRTSVRAGRILATLVSPEQGPQNSPYGFLLAAPADAQTPLAVIPLNIAGNGYTQGFGLRWDAAEGDYRLSGAVQGDQPAPTTGQIKGVVGFPSEGVPPLDLYIVNADDPSRYYWAPMGYDAGNIFTMTVGAGRYYVVAYHTAEGGTMAGAYSEFSRCGLLVSCADHSLVIVDVPAGGSVEGVQVNDWYAPDGTFPARP